MVSLANATCVAGHTRYSHTTCLVDSLFVPLQLAYINLSVLMVRKVKWPITYGYI